MRGGFVEARSQDPRGETLGGDKGQERRDPWTPGNTGPSGTDLLDALIPGAATYVTRFLIR